MPTYLDIARRASVSKATVSRVINNAPHVDVGTRAAVLQAAIDLGYPLDKRQHLTGLSQSALLLVREDSTHAMEGTWGVAGEFEARAMVGMKTVFDELGIATRLQRLRVEEMDFEKAAAYASEPSITGTMLIGGLVSDEFIAGLKSINQRFVLVGAHAHAHDVSCVTADYLKGMLQAVTHLTGQGRRRIAFVNGPPTTTSSEEKELGFRLALAMSGIECLQDHLREANFGYEAGFKQTTCLLEEVPNLEAISYAEDFMAVGGIRAIKQTGRRVPDDIAVTGFYGYEVGAFSDPPLTTVYFDIRAMGGMAARLLRNMTIAGADTSAAWQLVLPTSLIVRGSA